MMYEGDIEQECVKKMIFLKDASTISGAGTVTCGETYSMSFTCADMYEFHMCRYVCVSHVQKRMSFICVDTYEFHMCRYV